MAKESYMTKNTVKNRSKTAVIIAIAVSAAILAGIILWVCLALFGGRVYRFDYLSEDLSQYLELSDSDYKGYTLTVKMAKITDSTVDEEIMQTLYKHREREAQNPGKTVPLTIGDKLKVWYRGYYINDEGREEELPGLSNMTSQSPYDLGIGSASLPLGVESSLVGVVIADYASLEAVKRAEGDKIEQGDVVYLSYTLLSPSGTKNESGVRVDLNREDIDEIFGVGFRDAIIGKEIGEDKKLASFTTVSEEGRLVYSDVRISTVYPASSQYLTVDARLPYDYEDYDMAGMAIRFDIFPHYFTAYDVPEIDEEYLFETLKLDRDELSLLDGDTLLDKYKSHVRAYLIENNEEQLLEIKDNAMWQHYNSVAKVIEYPEEAVLAIYNTDLAELKLLWQEYKSAYPDFDEFARIYFELTEDSDWRAKLMDDAEAEVKEKLIFYYIIKKENLIPTEEEYKEIYDRIFSEFVDFYLDGKTEEDYGSEDEYAKARAEAEVGVIEFYGEDFFRDQTYYEFASEALFDFANVEITS